MWADKIALDAEFVPGYQPGETAPADLLQLATSTHVYLIDLMNMASEDTYYELTRLMDNYKVVKLGVDFKADLKAILKRLGRSEMVRLSDDP